MGNKQLNIKVDNLSFDYKSSSTKAKVLNDISFEAQKGEFVAILGPSGCGKTTLLYCLGGLLKPTNGQAQINEIKIENPEHSSIVFQEPLLLPWRNVFKNISYGAEMKKIPKKEISRITKKLIYLVNLKGFEKYYPHQLSGGMKQRVNLARGLASDPEVLLLDEPFSHLDAMTREIMQKELLNIYQKTRKTFILVTHDIEEAIYLADKVIVMSRRPGTIKKVIKINFRRPRDLSLKETKEFGILRKKIWNLISLKNV